MSLLARRIMLFLLVLFTIPQSLHSQDKFRCIQCPNGRFLSVDCNRLVMDDVIVFECEPVEDCNMGEQEEYDRCTISVFINGSQVEYTAAGDVYVKTEGGTPDCISSSLHTFTVPDEESINNIIYQCDCYSDYCNELNNVTFSVTGTTTKTPTISSTLQSSTTSMHSTATMDATGSSRPSSTDISVIQSTTSSQYPSRTSSHSRDDISVLLKSPSPTVTDNITDENSKDMPESSM